MEVNVCGHPHRPGVEFLREIKLERGRTPAELQDLLATIQGRLNGCPTCRQEARVEGDLWKKYFEEIRPLALFVRLANHQNVICTPNLGNDNYDAVIRYGPGVPKEFVEFTYAKCGYEEHLRNEVLNRDGRVNLFSPITSSRTKNTGHDAQVQHEEDQAAVPRLLTLAKHRRLVIEGIKKKARKQYGRTHILVVVFDGYLGFRSGQELGSLISSIKSEVDLSTLDFRALYLLSDSGDNLRQVPLAGQWLNSNT